MNWIVFAGSLAAILVLGGVAWALRLGGAERSFLAPEEALDAAEQAIAGFVGISAAVGGDGRAALAYGEQARIVVLKTHGARVAAREVRWDDIRATPGGMLVETRDRRFGAVLVTQIDNLDMRRLAS